jgi:hypothetical protein
MMIVPLGEIIVRNLYKSLTLMKARPFVKSWLCVYEREGALD